MADPWAGVRWLRQVIEGDKAAAERSVRYDPQDVIADCEAKLAMLDALVERSQWADSDLFDPLFGMLAASYRLRDGFTEHWGSDD